MKAMTQDQPLHIIVMAAKGFRTPFADFLFSLELNLINNTD
jgi:hypothetical protein